MKKTKTLTYCCIHIPYACIQKLKQILYYLNKLLLVANPSIAKCVLAAMFSKMVVINKIPFNYLPKLHL